MLPDGCSRANFILNASVFTSFPLSKADSSNGHVQCTPKVKKEAIGSDGDGDDNVDLCMCVQRHLVHHGRFNTLFNALFARYDARQLCFVCSAALLLGIALQITSDVSGDAEEVSDASNVEGDAAEEQNQDEENEEEENHEEEEGDEEEEEGENTNNEDDVSCPDRRIDSDVVKCDIACEETCLVRRLPKQRKADWNEQEGGDGWSLGLEPTVFCIVVRTAGHR